MVELANKRSDSRPDTRTLGPYRLERRLGAGAMGEVWLGRHTVSRGQAAVKIVRPENVTRTRVLEFFAREGRASLRLRHPHIAQVFEVGADFLAMAYVEGQDLARRLRSPMEPAAAVRIVLEIASALAHAHAQGVIHRDVKPSNILVDPRGTSYLADFGLAHIIDEEFRDHGHRVGTSAFMAPEQRRGEVPSPATDQYALARTLIEMLSGHSPAIERDDALALLPTETPPALHTAIARALESEPAARWPSIDAFAAAITGVDLGDLRPPALLRNEVRPRTPFAWLAGRVHDELVGADIVRADHRLSALEDAGLLAPDACARFREQTGLADFGWAVFARRARLGPVTEPAALARAAEVVVLMHGWCTTRDIWRDVAAAIARDEAQAVVLVPDLHGFGESRYASSRPAADHLGPRAVADTVGRWRKLLGIGGLPTVLCGHSMSAIALLSVGDDELGDNVSRVAVAPVFPWIDPAFLRRSRMGIRMFNTLGRIPAVYRRLGRTAVYDAAPTSDLTEPVRRGLWDQFSQISASVLLGLLRGTYDYRPVAASRLRRCAMLLGESDSSHSPEAVARGLSAMGIDEHEVRRLATASHYPHMESASHPEWTARNQAEIAQLVQTMMVASLEGIPATATASTVID